MATLAPQQNRRAWSARLARMALAALHFALVVASVAVVMALIVPYVRAALQTRPPQVPPTMEPVDWSDPLSSVYCLACHRQVAPAVVGLDVQRGHSQNVTLNATQLAAIEAMGTVAGPDQTLICMSCHKLGQDAAPYMLAESLEGSALCQRCHPGHYARGTPHDLRTSAPDEKNRFGRTVRESGPCSACHLAHSFAREIIPSPLDPDGYCITCHRAYHVAEGHARTRMHHPESHCLECHNPHDATHGNFLRAAGNDVCLRCHTDLGGGVAAGMHPLGPMKQAMPATLVVPGISAADRARNEITCDTCHSMHSSGHPGLLRMPPTTNELCLTCHREALVAKSHDGSLPRHGQSPVLREEQQAVVVKWGNPVGPGGELLCVSCHRVHGAEKSAHLLVEKPHYGDTCVRCHPQQAIVFGSAHDLRTNHPRERNERGLTTVDAGACSACHLAHEFPRQRQVAPGDPTGTCTSCHQPGRCGGQRSAGTVEHPGTVCTDCHDPHERAHGQFLRDAVGALCISCHAEQGRLLGGPHDAFAADAASASRGRVERGGPGNVSRDGPTRQRDGGEPGSRWKELSPNRADACLPCHVPHGSTGRGLFRLGSGAPMANHDDVCLACHQDAAWKADTDIAALHPQRINPEQKRVALALVPTDEAGEKRMGCRTCHDPHGPAEPAHLARVAPDEPTESLCLKCHVEKKLIKHTGHASAKLKQRGMDVDSCKPCHAMHARPDGSWGQMLSPRFLMPYCEVGPDQIASCLPCLACHRPDGPAPVREATTHPPVVMLNINSPADPGYLPLFNAAGMVDPRGQVVCRTCHVSHGRTDLLELLDRGGLTKEQQDNLRAQVRSFLMPNVCTACHGPEARNLFLLFHDAAGRKRALEAQRQTGSGGR